MPVAHPERWVKRPTASGVHRLSHLALVSPRIFRASASQLIIISLVDAFMLIILVDKKGTMS